MKKVISLTLILIMVVGLLSTISVFSATTSGKCGETLSWSYDKSEQALSIIGTGKMYNYDISKNEYAPWAGYKESVLYIDIDEGVTSIGDGAFFDFNKIRNITIAENIKSIGKQAFYSCDELLKINFNEKLETIGVASFKDCLKLRELYMPQSLKSVGQQGFEGCNKISSVVFGNKLESIGILAFNKCSEIKKLDFGHSPVVINNGAFQSCSSLTQILNGDKIREFRENCFSNCNSLGSIEIPITTTYISPTAFNALYLSSITVNEFNPIYCDIDGVLYNKKKDTLVRYPAYKEGTSYNILDGVKNILPSAFAYAWRLNEINIEGDVENIGEKAFYNCLNVTDIVLGDNIKSIGKEAFLKTKYYDNQENWSDGVLYINNHLIKGELSLTGDVIIKNEAVSVADGAFDNSALNNIEAPLTLMKTVGLSGLTTPVKYYYILENTSGNQAKAYICEYNKNDICTNVISYPLLKDEIEKKVYIDTENLSEYYKIYIWDEDNKPIKETKKI